jgi:hypothetical protein
MLDELQDPSSPTVSEQTASLYLMIAIGAQCRDRTPDDLIWAAKLFNHARKMAFDKMLENPTLEMTRAFLLMAFYMFGACRRNTAFMYLGVATKAAEILGLHMSTQYRHLSPAVRTARYGTILLVLLLSLLLETPS